MDGNEAREVTKKLSGLMQEKTAALKAEEVVSQKKYRLRVIISRPARVVQDPSYTCTKISAELRPELCRYRFREKKEYTPPSDPGWSRQWSLVRPIPSMYS